MRRTTLKNAAVGTLAGATLVAGVVLLAPGWGDGDRPGGPAARALAAAGAGAPAAPADLAALITHHEDRVRDRPEDARAWAELGAAYVERGVRAGDTGLFPKAERALGRSLALRPAERGNTAALVSLGALANARHDYRAGRDRAEQARKLRPKDWAAYPVLVDALGGLGDHAGASRAMDAFQELASGPQVKGREAQLYRDKGWREDAAALAYDAAEHSTTGAEKAAARHRQGELAWERGEYTEAIGHYDAALKAEPESHRSLAGRARALAALGRTAEAQRAYAEVLEKAPLPEYALEAGELDQSLGLDGDAATRYARMRELAGEARADGVHTALVLARYEADHGDPAVAVRLLQGEWRRGHRSVHMADAMGWALSRAGRADDALPFAKLATGQGLRSALFSYHRGEIERAAGEEGAARRHVEEALRTNPEFSPLLAPAARAALKRIGEPAPGGPVDLYGDGPTPLEEPEEG
ncbi:tetratricopeptide repeat protein [Streptomyces sp. NPDC005805]|uniref:tetratricopeptide repeat protein n=1 Tax=Streptomyces sp. NPDC005805 TaxID=3157068 RepID=UPI0033FDD176